MRTAALGQGQLLDAVTKCLIGARDLLPDDGVAVRQGIKALKAKLRELPRTSKKAAAKTDFDEIEGYRTRRRKVGPGMSSSVTHSIPFSLVGHNKLSLSSG